MNYYLAAPKISYNVYHLHTGRYIATQTTEKELDQFSSIVVVFKIVPFDTSVVFKNVHSNSPVVFQKYTI